MFHRQFRDIRMQQKLSGMKGWMAFIIGSIIISLVLLALPFLLLIGAVSFVVLSVFGRFYLKRKWSQLNRQVPGDFVQQQQSNQKQRDNLSSQGFPPKKEQGRTFEHNPDE